MPWGLCHWAYAVGFMPLGLCHWFYAVGFMSLGLCRWVYAIGFMSLGLCHWFYVIEFMSLVLCRRRVCMYVVRVNVAQVNVVRYTVGVPCQLSNYLAFLFNLLLKIFILTVRHTLYLFNLYSYSMVLSVSNIIKTMYSTGLTD